MAKNHSEVERSYLEGREHGHIADGLERYLSRFYSHVARPLTEPGIFPEEFLENVQKETIAIIATQSEIASQYSSWEYQAIVAKEKALRGPAKLGLVVCIDGRIAIPFLAGRIASCTEVKAGIADTVKIDGESQLTSGSLSDAIIDSAQEGPLLEFLFAHTSLSNPRHGCGAMVERQARGLVRGTNDLVLANLAANQDVATAVTAIFNRNRGKGVPHHTRVAVNAVFDTDTSGIILGYGESADRQLFTTQISASLAAGNTPLSQNFRSTITRLFRGKYDDNPGMLKSCYTDSKQARVLEQAIQQVTYALLSDEYGDNYGGSLFLRPINDLIDRAYADLLPDQRQAMRFFLSRNIAFHYLTGLYSADHGQLHHPHTHHREGYMAFSPNGPTLGQFDPENQVFGASNMSAVQMIDTMKTQISLLDNIGHKEPPYLFFLSTSRRGDESSQLSRNLNKDYFLALLQDDHLLYMIKSGKLIVIPVEIDQTSRKVLRILEHI